MTKRKKPEGDDVADDLSVPIPVQSFLWRQTSPFIRPKLGKLFEASCVSFERVIVQNIVHGLSPSLCEAIESISRWRLVRAAFPHVLHCCAAMLSSRDSAAREAAAAEQQSRGGRDSGPRPLTRPKFTPNEVKLLYALHWIILDAASECEDADNEAAHRVSTPTSSRTYLLSLDDIQLFIFLLAPLVGTVSESDFQTLKLENGLRLWEPLWNYSQPDVTCFTTPVKHQRAVLKAQRPTQTRVNFNMANIYVGHGTSTDEIYCGGGSGGGGNSSGPVSPEPAEDAPTEKSSRSGKEDGGSEDDDASLLAPLARMSDICALSMTETTVSGGEVNNPAPAAVCDMCCEPLAVGVMICVCGTRRRASFLSTTDAQSLGLPCLEGSSRIESAMNAFTRAYPNLDVLSASCFDVAVLRCLFCTQWPEPGVYWALRYLHRRLLEIASERQNAAVLQQRQRSQSLPTPEFRAISPGLGATPDHETQFMIGGEIYSSSAAEFDSHGRQPAFKRQKVYELGGRLGGGRTPPTNRSDPGGHGENDTDKSRPDSALSRLTENDEESPVEEEDEDVDDSSSDVAKKVRRRLADSAGIRPNASQQNIDEEEEDSSGSGGRLLQKPIIMITADSPGPSPASRSPVWSSFIRRDSQLSTSSRQFGSSRPVLDGKSTLSNTAFQRSMTDSTINYGGAPGAEDSVDEIPGSAYYVSSDGQMDYSVVLRAVHTVSGRQCTTRTCAVLLNTVNCLADLGILENSASAEKPSATAGAGTKDPGSVNSGENGKSMSGKGSGQDPSRDGTGESMFFLSLETVFRVYKSLGCPHGCRDGVKGSPGDDLRIQAQSCLQRLMHLDPIQFRTYIQHSLLAQSLQSVMDQLHAVLGFCAEPISSLQTSAFMGPRKSVLDPPISRTGYGHNFGEQLGGGSNVHGKLIVQILKPLLDKCVNSRKELMAHENIGLYCDVRQLLTYVKESHGSTFRRVALGGLLDALKHPSMVPLEPQQPKVIRRNLSVTSDSGDERESRSTLLNGTGLNKARKSLFRTKIRKHILPGHGSGSRGGGVTSDSENYDDSLSFHGRLSPRVSLALLADDDVMMLPKRKSSKFNIAWRRNTKSDHEDDSASETPPTTLTGRGSSQDLLARAGGSHSGVGSAQRQKQRMSFKAAGQATLGFLTRRRLEDGLRCFSKRRQSTRRESLIGDVESFYRAAHDAGPTTGANGAKDTVIIREKKLINSYIVKSGMLRFNFMLDCSNPGSLPDAHLVAALLDLEAPVVARAAMLLECAHLVSRCNHGDWPHWMKLNLPGFCATGLPQPMMLHARGQPSGYRRNLVLQRATGRLFHQWAEALGNHLSDILADELADLCSIVEQVKDETKRKELRINDDEEDFLDESTVNLTGSDCPYALKLVACQLLLEITTFLRETYQHLPRSKATRRSGVGLEPPWVSVEKQAGGSSSRRWSSVLGSPGNSERSNSRSSQGECHLQGNVADRKISFAVLGTSERSDSLHSSTTSISQMEAGADGKGRSSCPQKLLKTRRGSGHNMSFKQNRSFKMKRPEDGGSVKRMGSVKSRKVSTQSLQSTVSADDTASSSYAIFEEASSPSATEAGGGGIGGATVMGDECPESATDGADSGDEMDYSRHMPWVKVVVQLANTSNFICDHMTYCHPNCYERQRRSCVRLTTALRQVYNSEPPEPTEEPPISRSESSKGSIKDKLKRRESMFQTSPTSRRESTPLLDKVKVDISLAIKAKMAIAAEKEEEKKRKARKPKEELPVLKYLDTQVLSLTHSPLAVITKSAAILPDEMFTDMMPVAWELLIESDQELAAAAAVVFILASVRVPEAVKELMSRQLHHSDVAHRTSAIIRFSVLWRFRFQVWPRMEDGAHIHFKVPPPSIDFVLPSPTIGLPCLPIVDPPWTPHFKAKVEEVTINQNETKSFVTATTTRRKQQQQMVHRALLAEEDRRRAARENFRMLTVPVQQQASCEPALLHSGNSDDHEDAVLQEEMALAAASRRMSVAPVNRAASNIRNMSGRHGSMFYGRSTFAEGDDEKGDHFHSHHMQVAQQFFPSCICGAALHIIHLLDDLEVNGDGVAVCAVAEKVIWDCLVEDPTLFLRTFLEKLTHRTRQDELVFLLRKLLYYIGALPAQTAHSLFNYIIGFIMFYVRSPAEGGQDAIAKALSILWLVVPSVHGIYFKDLKQTLRKEQCDPTLMVTANVPSAKKLIVHGPDLSCIPSQFPIQEDTQFLHILHESLDFFNIPAEEQACYFLVDTKTNQMHNTQSYVRDFYFFRRNFYPQLSLVHMNPDEASSALQFQALTRKCLEMGKVLFSLAVVESSQSQQVQSHVSFLHEELLKLPSFPRKALESEFGLYAGDMGEEISGVDLMHKYTWTKLIATMFGGMSSTVTHAGDLPLFLNVTNGTLLLHANDTAMLRLCLATFVNACRHFKQVFATTGFTFIMPTILKVYSSNLSNPVICDVIEFTCRQFFLLHRNPFVLQMFGSVSPILNMADDDSSHEPDCTKVEPEALFRLLLSLANKSADRLNILDIVDGDKPLQPLDFCYRDDPEEFTILDAINLCVTVIAYACDSVRALQMLVILSAILPPYLNHLKEKTSGQQDSATLARDEMAIITSVSVSIRTLVNNCEPMARNFSGPQWQWESVTTNTARTQQQNHANHSGPKTTRIYADEQSDVKFLHMEEGLSDWNRTSIEDESELALNNFRRPRNILLCIVSHFFHHCTTRWRELRRLLASSPVRTPDLLDHRTHNCLADIAHTLLKIAPYDPPTMKSVGLKRYMSEVLPLTDWSQTAVRPALNLILRRLERLFCKVYKKYILRQQMDWTAATNLVKAVHNTLANCAYVAHLPHLKTLIATCLNIVLSDDGGAGSDMGSDHSVVYKVDGCTAKSAVPTKFCSATIKLTALQMHSLGDLYSLEQVCGGMSVFPSTEKTMNMIINLILPLCIRMGSGNNRKENPSMRLTDISFALSVVLHALVPPMKQQMTPTASGGSTKQRHLSVSDSVGGRTGSVMSHHGGRKAAPPQDSLQTVAFLGLKLLMVCFEKQLSTQWYRIYKCLLDLGMKLQGGTPLWKFLDFVVTVRMPLYVMLKPFIQFKMMKVTCDTEQEYFLQQTVYQKLQGCNMPHPKSKGSLLIDLAAELRQVKEDLAFVIADMRSGGLASPVHSNRSQRSYTFSGSVAAGSGNIPKTSSIHDLLEHQVAARMQSVPTSQSSAAKQYRAAPSYSVTGTTGNQSAAAGSATEGGTDSPSRVSRTTSRRIIAKDGSSLVLARYSQKPSISQDDDAVEISKSVVARRLLRRPISSLRNGQVAGKKLSQQAACTARSAVSQPSICVVEAASVEQVGPSPESPQAFVRDTLIRKSPVIFRGILRIPQSRSTLDVNSLCRQNDFGLSFDFHLSRSTSDINSNLNSPPCRGSGRNSPSYVAGTQNFLSLTSTGWNSPCADDVWNSQPSATTDPNSPLTDDGQNSPACGATAWNSMSVDDSRNFTPFAAPGRNSQLFTEAVVTNLNSERGAEEPSTGAATFTPRARLSSAEAEDEETAHLHRLQRQDAKSRKTFKIKRNRSTIRGSTVARSATVKAGGFGVRYHAAAHGGKDPDDLEVEPAASGPGNIEDPFDLPEQTEDSEESPSAGQRSAEETSPPGAEQLEMKAMSNGRRKDALAAGKGRSDTVDDASSGVSSRYDSPPSSKGRLPIRFMQKSKSHDSDSMSADLLAHAPIGTVRARIARQGARQAAQSRSPSNSPTLSSAPRDRAAWIAEATAGRRGVEESSSSDEEEEEEENGVDDGKGAIGGGGMEYGEILLQVRETAIPSHTTTPTGSTSILIDFDDTGLKDTRV